jgi:dipeptidyl aminopeptidase/acylaminoacyl peptidase
MTEKTLPNHKAETPYGQWNSPITPAMISKLDKSLRSTHIAIEGQTIYWTETRPEEKGRTVLLSRNRAGTIREVTPSNFDVKTKVHEYGGAPYALCGEILYFVNRTDQILYAQHANNEPKPLTRGEIRLTDIQWSSQGLIAIAEKGGSEKVANFLILLDPETGQWKILDQGHDFYSSPALSPDGSHLAWLTWDHPNMPWDSTQLWIGEIKEGRLENKVCAAGGSEVSIFQPQWSPQGNLYFVSDRDGWWNIHRAMADNSTSENVLPREAEFGLPQWVFGMSTWGFTGRGEEILCAYSEQGFWKLGLFDPHKKNFRKVEAPFTDYSQIRLGQGFAALLAGSPATPRRILRLDLDTLKMEPIDEAPKLQIDPEDLSVPQNISFETADGSTAFGYFYPPANKVCQGPAGERPPLLVFSHGGPTGCADSAFNLKIQYWTSRGFAAFDVNYRGSTGFGRLFREKLKGNWGVADVEDCTKGALYLANKGLVNAEKMMIRGSSAGGYTTLAALTFTNTFAAGASYYGVGDLLLLARDTHKFESCYLDTLIGPLPACKQLYQDRSPLYHADKITCPIIFFHGENDKVVPKAQTEAMYNALKQNGIPTKLILYPNEDHGFRQAKHIEDALEQELNFYLEVL